MRRYPRPKHKLLGSLSQACKNSIGQIAATKATNEKLPHLLPSLDRQSETTIQHTSNNNSSSQPAIMSQSTISVELMTTETFNLGEAAVGVADLFEGTNPPVEFLTKRAGDMLRANPWLAGRLKTVDGQPHLVWSAEPSAADEAELFSVVDVKDLPGVEDVSGAVDLLNMYVGPETPDDADVWIRGVLHFF